MKIAGNGGYVFQEPQQEKKEEKNSILELYQKLREFNESVHQWNLRLKNPQAQQEEIKRYRERRIRR